MTQYTSNYAIPYPTSGDPVHLGASQMEALAKKVDTTMKTVYDASAVSATSTATPNLIVKRDSTGQAQFATPKTASAAATKGYVDGLVNGLIFKKSTTAPAAGTAANIVTFVV